MVRVLMTMAFVLVAVPTFAQADPEPRNGNRLLKYCSQIERDTAALSTTNMFQSIDCVAYIRGIRDAEWMHSSTRTATFCVPEAVTDHQLALAARGESQFAHADLRDGIACDRETREP